MTSPVLSDKNPKRALMRLLSQGLRGLQLPHQRQEGWRTWLFEIFVLTAVIVALSVVLQPRVMLMSASPHPLWLPVVAASLVHGTFPGLAAAVIAGLCAWLFGPPPMTTEEDYYDLMFRAFKDPVLWLFAALLLGTYRDRIEAERQKLGQERDQAQDDLALVVEHATALRRRVDDLERAVVLADVLPAQDGVIIPEAQPHVEPEMTEPEVPPTSVVPLPTRRDREIAPAAFAPAVAKESVLASAPGLVGSTPRFRWSWASLWVATPQGWKRLGWEGQESFADPGRLLRHFDQQCRVYDSRYADDRSVLPLDALLAVPVREGLAPASKLLIVGGGHIDQDLSLEEAIKAVLPIADRLGQPERLRASS